MSHTTNQTLTNEELQRVLHALNNRMMNSGAAEFIVELYRPGAKRAVTVKLKDDGICVANVECMGESAQYSFPSQQAMQEVFSKTAVYLYDDGEFFIEENANYEPGTGNVFLCKRCMRDLTTPGGFTCVGGADQHGGKNWRADIHQVPTEDTDCTTVYDGENRSAAIAELWARRNDAYVPSSIRC